MLTIRQLRYLDALARCQHFGRAAEECAVSQPALSMQIRELEEFLGIELFERRPGAPILTGVGIEIAQRAGAILSATRDENGHYSLSLRGLQRPLKVSRAFGHLFKAM